MTLHVEVVSPERILWTGEADMVTARTVGGGDIAFLTGHAPFVGALDIGKVMIRPADGADELVAVHGGFVEVSNNRVTILSDVAEVASQIDIARAQAAAERAEAALRAETDVEAEAALRRAHVRIAVAGGQPAATSGH
ncbi:MAG: ATP synthase F1 subunit epsilon [Acidimicrobiales bacterium]